MSHTLHRQGSDESISKDFVVLSRVAEEVNRTGSKEQLEKFVRLGYEHNPANLGNHQGNMYAKTYEEICGNIIDGRGSNIVFSSREDLKAYLKDLQAIHYSISVTVSGMTDIVKEVAEECGIKLHSISMSLGVFGNVKRLPDKEILAITTMCGHHQVSPGLVSDVMEKVKSGKLTPHEGALKVAAPCPCGVLNARRAEEIFADMLQQKDF
ncbi:MAG: hypothetical protein ACOYI4_05720 [Christensenellales bacterium]|jgi:hypothetical protein